MGDINHNFRNELWLVDHAMEKENGLEVFWAQNLRTSECGIEFKGQVCVKWLSKAFIGAVESVIQEISKWMQQ